MEYEQSEISKNTGNKRKIAFVSGIVMTAIYLSMGILLIFTNFFTQITHTIRIILGIIFVLYGFYRGYRAIKKLKS